MAHELQLDLALNKDRVQKGKKDEQIKGRLQLLSGKKNQPMQKEKINLVFVLDSSGSMKDPYYQTGKKKAEVVFDAVNSLLNHIDNRDTVSIISFNTQAVVHADHLPGGAKQGIQEAMQRYRNDNGATNFEAAMKMTLSLCQNRAKENHKCIFLTDGNSYTGDDNIAFQTCQEMANLGITVDSMGIGEGFNFNFMKQFSDMSGSMTENIIQINQTRAIFDRIYTSSGNVFLKKVFINFFFSDKVRDIHFYMHSPEQKNLHKFITTTNNGTSVQVNAGDLEQESLKEFLFDFTLDTPNTPSLKVADVSISYDCPSQNTVNGKSDQNIYLNLADDDNPIANSLIDTAYRDIELLQMEENVIKLTEQNKYKEAAVVLEKMAITAESIGDYEKAKFYREKKNEIMRGNNLTKADLNLISSTTSRGSVPSMKTHSQKAKKQDLF